MKITTFARLVTLLGPLVVLGSGCNDGTDTDEPDGHGGAHHHDGDSGGSGGADPSSGGAGGTTARPSFGGCDGYATEVIDVAYGDGAGFGQSDMPDIVLGPPQGSGELHGSFDVVALGNGGSITLGFGEQTIVDGEGPDFIIFENAFYAGGDPNAVFAELAQVLVSADGETWFSFSCTATEAPFGECAGWHPVYANAAKDSGVDAHDPVVAGGDAFDLAAVGLSEARYVRIVDRADTTGLAGSFDLDAVALVSWECAGP